MTRTDGGLTVALWRHWQDTGLLSFLKKMPGYVGGKQGAHVGSHR
jgi:hypothetical protein